MFIVNVNILGSACQCPNDLYTCDLALGCICPEGLDCGLEVIELAPLLFLAKVTILTCFCR